VVAVDVRAADVDAVDVGAVAVVGAGIVVVDAVVAVAPALAAVVLAGVPVVVLAVAAVVGAAVVGAAVAADEPSPTRAAAATVTVRAVRRAASVGERRAVRMGLQGVRPVGGTVSGGRRDDLKQIL
jgi:hypothetical protein